MGWINETWYSVEERVTGGQTEECGSVWLWTRVWGSVLSKCLQFGGCRSKETTGFEWLWRWIYRRKESIGGKSDGGGEEKQTGADRINIEFVLRGRLWDGLCETTCVAWEDVPYMGVYFSTPFFPNGKKTKHSRVVIVLMSLKLCD